MNLILLGPPASGKGTQAEFLSQKLNIPTLSMGQLLREEVKRKTTIGQQVAEIMSSGELVPNSLSNELLWRRIQQADCQQGFILDGFPRTRIQAKFLDDKLKDWQKKIDHVVLVVITDEEVVRRLAGRRTCSQCGDIYHLEFNPPKQPGKCDECGGKLIIRPDDTEQAIRQRLKIYHEETEKVVEYYQQQGKLLKVDGNQSIESVRDNIFRLILNPASAG